MVCFVSLFAGNCASVKYVLFVLGQQETLSLIDFSIEFVVYPGVQSPHYENDTNSFQVRKLVITPSRKVFLPPEVIMSNRVLREYNHDYALRVLFREDDLMRKLRPSESFWFEVSYSYLLNELKFFLFWSYVCGL